MMLLMFLIGAGPFVYTYLINKNFKFSESENELL